MSYEVQYGEKAGFRMPVAEKRKLPVKKFVILIAAAAVAALLMIPNVRDALIPGNAQVTKQAAGEMIQRIQDGEGVVDAFAQFCQQIIRES